MDGEHVWESGRHGADAAIEFRSLAMNDVWLESFQLRARGPDAPLIKRSHPTDLWDDQAVKENIGRQFFGRLHWLADARNHVHLRFRKVGETLKQGLRCRAKPRHGRRILLERFAVVRC